MQVRMAGRRYSIVGECNIECFNHLLPAKTMTLFMEMS